MSNIDITPALAHEVTALLEQERLQEFERDWRTPPAPQTKADHSPRPPASMTNALVDLVVDAFAVTRDVARKLIAAFPDEDDRAMSSYVAQRRAENLPILDADGQVDPDGSRARRAREDARPIDEWRADEEQLQAEIAEHTAEVTRIEGELAVARTARGRCRDALGHVRQVIARHEAKAQVEADKVRAEHRHLAADANHDPLRGLLAEEHGVSLRQAERALYQADGDYDVASAKLRAAIATARQKAAATESPSGD